ncbi:MAG TPA: hypothetical protein VFV23_01560 [Verrucomicrobiae bacterium]|nr:hypothetical protein [Verrucomicrobiae bacterium]
MKWLPRDRRNPFIAVIAISMVIAAGIYFILIRGQYDSLSKLAQGKTVAIKEVDTYAATIRNADADAKQLSELTNRLSSAESDMASGDLVFWTYDTIRRLKQQYKIDTTDIGRPTMSDVDFLPTFPYKQMKFFVSGTAYYHDLGKFVSDFENQFPHARIVGLGIEPSSDPQAEKLAFNMQIVVLVKNQP